MSDTVRQDNNSPRVEEERLAHALVSRGLITREEVQQCRVEQALGAEKLLDRMVEGGFLTVHQARRARQELSTLLEQQIPGYQLQEKLGQGAMGVVFKAQQISMNRQVAIKLLNPRWAAKREFLERFRREARLAAKLSHNNIVQAIDVGSAGPLHYFVMEFVEGKTIRQELDDGKVFDEREAVEIIVQVAQALQHAHRRGLIHRDVKPANIVLTSEGIAKLADLGMARETADEAQARQERGWTMGTPFYIAPEQVKGEVDIDVRADLYSLGATLYHMVTGRPPFYYKETDRILAAHLKERLTPPDHIRKQLSSGLGEVVELLMAKKREDRYQIPDDLILDLECLLNDEPPRFARQKIEAATLEALGEGEEEDEDGDMDHPTWMVVYVVVGLLAFSLVLNFVQVLSR